jgi:site-specific DNA-cytosine methylase
VGKGVAQTLDTQCNQGIWIADYRADEGLRIRKDNISPCMTSSMKGGEWKANQGTRNPPLVGLYNDKRLNQTIEKNKDKLIEGEIKMLDTYNQSVHDHSPCIKARHHQNNDRRLFDGYKIRRLTPRECFRLMDFPDTFKMPCSDTQMYKQAGNSIVVGVLAELIKKLKL